MQLNKEAELLFIHPSTGVFTDKPYLIPTDHVLRYFISYIAYRQAVLVNIFQSYSKYVFVKCLNGNNESFIIN